MRKPLIRQIARMFGLNFLFLLEVIGIFALFYLIFGDREPSDFLRMTLVLALAEIGLSLWYSVRFLTVVRRQERLGFPFSDGGIEYFRKISDLGIAGEWFIRSGRIALHRQAICDVSLKRIYRKTSYRYRFTVFTSDGRKYRLEFYRKEDASRFLKWSGFAGRSGEDEELL